MATPGTYVSAAAHVGLIAFLFLGWGFDADPLPFEVSEVSVVSGEEYARLVAATTPQPGTAEPTAPPVPDVETPPPPPEVAPETPPTPTPPEVVEPPAPEAPLPEPQIAAEPPVTAEVAPDLPAQPETPPQGAPDLPPSETPQERQADRVAPTPVAPPPDDVAIADIDTASAAPDVTEPADIVEEQVEETAQEETATAIVPEDLTPSGAVETSVRPSTRPNRPAPAPVTPAETTTASSDNVEENPVDEAVAAALSSAADVTAPAPDVPQGPPMTGSEREGFRVAVNRCWNVDPGSVAARVTLEVGFSLDQSGNVTGEVRQISATGGDANAVNTAFQAARRAILRCQAPNGYQLPADKYGQWKDVVITFDPSGMRLR